MEQQLPNCHFTRRTGCPSGRLPVHTQRWVCLPKWRAKPVEDTALLVRRKGGQLVSFKFPEHIGCTGRWLQVDTYRKIQSQSLKSGNFVKPGPEQRSQRSKGPRLRSQKKLRATSMPENYPGEMYGEQPCVPLPAFGETAIVSFEG
jgi:hypothetical protein